MYIMAPEPISTAHFLNPSHQSVCLYVYPLSAARQRLSKDVTQGNEYKRNYCWRGRFLCGPIRMKGK
jgi:hypothetical protein